MRVEFSRDSTRILTPRCEMELVRDAGRVFIYSVGDIEKDTHLLEGCPAMSLWQVTSRPGGNAVKAASSESESRISRRGGGVDVIWDQVQLGESECQVIISILPDDSGLLKFLLDFRSRRPVPLWDIEFPILGGLLPGTLYTPYGYGKAIASDGAERYVGEYPGHHCTMQLLAWNIGSSSLYLGAHDPASSTKSMEYLPGEGQTIACRLPLPGMGRGRTAFEMPYPTLVGPIKGDWYDVARFYRSWALDQIWCSAGPLHRREIPQRIRDVPLWLQIAGGPEEVVPKALEFHRYFGVPMAMHWYEWHEIPFDDRYPDYFPPKEGFKEAVARLGNAGIIVMPYINARLWDSSTESWSREGALAAAAKDADLAKYVEVYASKVPLSPMCPSTQLWQRKIASIVSTLARDYGVHGIYLDQIGAAAPKLCFDSSHGHPVGGGGWWVEGYRHLLDGVGTDVTDIDPEFFLTTESNAEPWNDRLDAVLMCNSTEGDLVPIYPAVYGDMILTFGAYIFRRDLEDSWAFRAKLSQMFLWGTQLGWLGPEILEPGFLRNAEYLRELAKARLSASNFLRNGEMLRPPRLEEGGRLVRTTWELWNRTWKVEMPSAQASCWRAPDGSLGVVGCNMDDQDTDLDISVSLADPGWRELNPRRLKNGKLSAADPRIDGERLHLILNLQARSGACLSSRAGS